MNTTQPETSSTADTALAGRAAAGDATAFELIMRRHNRMMFRAARAILRDDGEAEDAVQEAYVRAYRALAGFRGEARLSTWLTRIAVNEALGRRRQRRESPLADVPPDDVAAAWPQGSPTTPEEASMRKELGEVLEAAVDRLPESYRTVLMLRAVEGLSERDTADILGIAVPLVKVRLFRARRLLRRTLESRFESGLGEVFAFDGARCDRIVAAVRARLGLNPASAQDAPSTPTGVRS